MQVQIRRRRSGPERFAEDFTVLLAQEAHGIGKVRVTSGWSFLRWAEQALRGSGGDVEKLGKLVGWKLFVLLYGPSKNRPVERAGCEKKGLVFARRHRLILAEQVLAGNVMELAAGEVGVALEMLAITLRKRTILRVVRKVFKGVDREIRERAKDRTKRA